MGFMICFAIAPKAQLEPTTLSFHSHSWKRALAKKGDASNQDENPWKSQEKKEQDDMKSLGPTVPFGNPSSRDPTQELHL